MLNNDVLSSSEGRRVSNLGKERKSAYRYYTNYTMKPKRVVDYKWRLELMKVIYDCYENCL